MQKLKLRYLIETYPSLKRGTGWIHTVSIQYTVSSSQVYINVTLVLPSALWSVE
jgi:hypothetical protein